MKNEQVERQKLVVAIMGNPNTGKTSLFNLLTSKTEATGNWPGVTVEKQVGYARIGDYDIEFVDLPGIYDLHFTKRASEDERAVDYFLLFEKFDLVLNVIDGNNYERNLHLSAQLVDLGKPMLMAINFTDMVQRGLPENLADEIAADFGVHVVPISCKKRIGIDRIRDLISYNKFRKPKANAYPKALIQGANDVGVYIADEEKREMISMKYVENGDIDEYKVSTHTFLHIQEVVHKLEQAFANKIHQVMSDVRSKRIFNLIDNMFQHNPDINKDRQDDVIDRIVFSRFLAIPIFIFVLFCLFSFSIGVGGMFQGLFEAVGRAIFVDLNAVLLHRIHAPQILNIAVSSGFGGGVTTVISFIPLIWSLYFFQALLEDCGYMTRAAILTDGWFRKIGLPGQSIMPLLVSFGCNVPGIYSVRALNSYNARIRTALMAPFMSCSARLTVYALMCSVFFVDYTSVIVLGLYLFGIGIAVAIAFVLKFALPDDEFRGMVLELPRYQIPSLPLAFYKAKTRLKSFCFGAGKVIVAVFLLVQLLTSISPDLAVRTQFRETSILAELGKAVTPAFSPMGIKQEEWPLVAGLLAGIVAKEVVVGTISAIYMSDAIYDEPKNPSLDIVYKGMKEGINDFFNNFRTINLGSIEDLSDYKFMENEVLSEERDSGLVKKLNEKIHDKAMIFAYLVFVLLYFPCVSVFAAIKQEIGTKWAVISASISTVLAYILACATYQILSVLW